LHTSGVTTARHLQEERTAIAYRASSTTGSAKTHVKTVSNNYVPRAPKQFFCLAKTDQQM